MTLNIKDKLFTYQHNLFNIFLIISWVTYAFLVFGVFKVAPEYLMRLDYYVKIYVSLFLLYRLFCIMYEFCTYYHTGYYYIKYGK
jgi:hypothetical protein